MTEPREKLVEQTLSKLESRYLICSLISKRANQIVKHQDSQGVAWAIDEALQELVEGKLRYQPAAGAREKRSKQAVK